MPEKEIGVVGLGTIGAGLARNFASHGVRVAVYNRTHRRTEQFIADHSQEGDFIPAATLEELARVLQPPRAVAVLVNAGRPVDDVIDELTKALDKDDVIIDGGNSFFQDTRRRAAAQTVSSVRASAGASAARQRTSAPRRGRSPAPTSAASPPSAVTSSTNAARPASAITATVAT